MGANSDDTEVVPPKTLPVKTGRGGGFEPKSENNQGVAGVKANENSVSGHPLEAPQHSGQGGEDVSDVVLAWANLPQKVRSAIIALVNGAKGGRA